MILKDIEKKYGERVAFRCGLLELEDKKITAVLGESGAGKTTLLNVISGMTEYRGEVTNTGKVSHLFQSAKLLPNLTAEENLRFVLTEDRYAKAIEMLDQVGLGDKRKRYPRELSGGERQRVAIARAFVYPHDTLLMDEPFASLDLSLKRSLIALVLKLWKETGDTVVFVTHDVHEAALLSSRAVVVREGEPVLDLLIPAPYPRDFLQTLPEERTLTRALLREI